FSLAWPGYTRPSAWVHNSFFFFFFQAEDGIRDLTVTGVQTCALPIWIHGYAANSQDGVSPTAAARCLPNPVRRDSLSTLSTRRHHHETDGRADAFAPLVFFADFRSPPGPREAPSFVHGAGDRRGGRAVRDARLPGH